MFDRFALGSPAPHLAGRQVYLRPPQPDDWPHWARLRAESRDFLAPWEPSWPADGLTQGAFRRRLRRYAREAREGYGHAFLIFRRGDHRLVGGMTLSNVRRGVAQSCSAGYWIGKPYARQGLMSDALRATIRFTFAELGLHRLEAACLPANEASQGLLLKVGFRREGYAREYLRIDGAWRDHVLFALLATDPWER